MVLIFLRGLTQFWFLRGLAEILIERVKKLYEKVKGVWSENKSQIDIEKSSPILKTTQTPTLKSQIDIEKILKSPRNLHIDLKNSIFKKCCRKLKSSWLRKKLHRAQNKVPVIKLQSNFWRCDFYFLVEIKIKIIIFTLEDFLITVAYFSFHFSIREDPLKSLSWKMPQP